MRATVWAIARISKRDGSEIETVKSSPREARAVRHCARLNRYNLDEDSRYVLKGDKIKR